MRGPNGGVADVIRYRDEMQPDRRVYRLTDDGEYSTPEDLPGWSTSPSWSRTTQSPDLR